VVIGLLKKKLLPLMTGLIKLESPGPVFLV